MCTQYMKLKRASCLHLWAQKHTNGMYTFVCTHSYEKFSKMCSGKALHYNSSLEGIFQVSGEKNSIMYYF
jgi:hypothetical protein